MVSDKIINDVCCKGCAKIEPHRIRGLYADLPMALRRYCWLMEETTMRGKDIKMKTWREMSDDLFGKDEYDELKFGVEGEEKYEEGMPAFMLPENKVQVKGNVKVDNIEESMEERLERIEKQLDYVIYMLGVDKPCIIDKENNEELKIPEVKESEELSTVAKNVGEPDAMFERADADANIKSRVTVWIEEGDNESSKIVAFTEASKMDGTNRCESKHTVSRKGIMNFTKDEITEEIERYYQKLMDQGYGKVK